MGFLDKVKESATAAAAATKEAAQKGQAKLDEMQAKKAADIWLRDLGAVVYGQATGRGPANADAEVERLTGSLKEYEDEHGPIDLSLDSAPGSTPGTGPAGGPPASDSDPPSSPPPPPTAQTL